MVYADEPLDLAPAREALGSLPLQRCFLRNVHLGGGLPWGPLQRCIRWLAAPLALCAGDDTAWLRGAISLEALHLTEEPEQPEDPDEPGGPPLPAPNLVQQPIWPAFVAWAGQHAPLRRVTFGGNARPAEQPGSDPAPVAAEPEALVALRVACPAGRQLSVGQVPDAEVVQAMTRECREANAAWP